MESTHEQFKTNDGIDDDDKENEQCNIDERNDGHEDGVHDNLETRNSRDQSQWSQDTEGSESFNIKAFYL